MTKTEKITPEMVKLYFDLFVNRLAHTLQSFYPDDNGRHRYYRPMDRTTKEPVPLTTEAVKRHLEGSLTLGLYALNPQTNCAKWVAIDADYSDAIVDLLKLQWELLQDGVEAALEKSRRGGHLWIFADTPLPARDCLIYIANIAKRLKVPFRKGGLVEGIEIFPRQEQLAAGEFGNGIRGPLGVHRAVNRRYWFYNADYSIAAQLAYLQSIKKMTQADLSRSIQGLSLPEEFHPKPKLVLPPYNPMRREFRILDYVTVKRRSGRNFWAQCPSCARMGKDKAGDNLAICIADPRLYKCWAGCEKEQIRAALGHPIRVKAVS